MHKASEKQKVKKGQKSRRPKKQICHAQSVKQAEGQKSRFVMHKASKKQKRKKSSTKRQQKA